MVPLKRRWIKGLSHGRCHAQTSHRPPVTHRLTTVFRPPSMYTPFVGLPFMRRPWRSKIPGGFSVIYRLRMIRRTDPIIFGHGAQFLNILSRGDRPLSQRDKELSHGDTMPFSWSYQRWPKCETLICKGEVISKIRI